ncbi:alpha/beta fold hydrolase [Microbulbifer sp. ALW1]|uniref:alpha/beta fold hydrolase n=1 Tax=Microbulbifer sp. (strain ALW1) TaxID=1516059 RepID=UPI00191258E7|nr:alpha/beta hydrolase [Microbulbifer sp. ALW1]
MHSASPPVALIPGFMLDATLWNEFKNYLPEDWSIVDAPLGDGPTIRDMARQIAENLPQRFVLIGFSLGGYIARQLAADYPERVEALIIVASSLREDTAQQKKAKMQAVQALTPERFRGLSNSTIAHSLHPDNAADKALVAYIKEMSRRLGYQALATQSALDRSQVPAATIDCPTLVIASPNDALRSLEEAEELAAAIPNAVLRLIEDCGHMIPLEQPQALAESIVCWLEQLR